MPQLSAFSNENQEDISSVSMSDSYLLSTPCAPIPFLSVYCMWVCSVCGGEAADNFNTELRALYIVSALSCKSHGKNSGHQAGR